MGLESLPATLALIGIVILVSSLLSGAVERTGLPQVAIFLLVGAALGPAGLGLVDLTLDSPALQVIATLGLVLVLFSDAIGVDIGEVEQQRRLALCILGPGTLLPAALIAFAALVAARPLAPRRRHPRRRARLDRPGAAPHPLRHPSLPPPPRLALRLESGMNDVILLPIVVLSMLALGVAWTGRSRGPRQPRRRPLPARVRRSAWRAGYVAITLLDQVRRRVGVRRDYESLYALGVAFTAFAAAEAVGGSGFLAAFAAGLIVAALDVELCDCFLDYGEASAEMFLLLTFVAFGAGLIWTGLRGRRARRRCCFAGIALVVRTVVLVPVLRLAGVKRGRPPAHRALRAAGAELAAAGAAAGVRRVRRVGGPLHDHLSGGAALGGDARRRDRAVSAGRSAQRRRDADGRRQIRRPAAAPPTPPACPCAARSIRASRPPPRQPLPEKITIEELRELDAVGRAVVIARRPHRAELPRRRSPGQGAIRMPPDDAVRLAREIDARPARDARAVLCVKGRSHKRPGGARAS